MKIWWKKLKALQGWTMRPAVAESLEWKASISNTAQESERERSAWVYYVTASWIFRGKNVKKKKKEKRKKSIGLQNAAKIFHFCIVASRQNLYGPLDRQEYNILHHLIEYSTEGRNLFSSLCKTLVNQGIRILKLSLSVAWNCNSVCSGRSVVPSMLPLDSASWATRGVCRFLPDAW